MNSTARAIATLESARVSRYHAVPTVAPQTVGLHSAGVAVICIYLMDGSCSAALLQAAVLHDAAELFTGDIPFTVKRDRPEIKQLVQELEEQAHDHLVMPMPELTPQEAAVLKLADTLEGYLWCRKTETNNQLVLGRWSEALGKAFHKFADVLTVRIMTNARELANAKEICPS